MQAIDCADFKIRDWKTSVDTVNHVLSGLFKGRAVFRPSIAIRESWKSPAGVILAFLDPAAPLQVVFQVNPLNAEQAHELMKRDGARLVDLEGNGNAPTNEYGIPLLRASRRSAN